jgi:hypothetical protein
MQTVLLTFSFNKNGTPTEIEETGYLTLYKQIISGSVTESGGTRTESFSERFQQFRVTFTENDFVTQQLFFDYLYSESKSLMIGTEPDATVMEVVLANPVRKAGFENGQISVDFKTKIITDYIMTDAGEFIRAE